MVKHGETLKPSGHCMHLPTRPQCCSGAFHLWDMSCCNPYLAKCQAKNTRDTVLKWFKHASDMVLQCQTESNVMHFAETTVVKARDRPTRVPSLGKYRRNLDSQLWSLLSISHGKTLHVGVHRGTNVHLHSFDVEVLRAKGGKTSTK